MPFTADTRCGMFNVELNKNFVALFIDYEEEINGEYYSVEVEWDNEFEHYVGMLENEINKILNMNKGCDIYSWICENYSNIVEYENLNWNKEYENEDKANKLLEQLEGLNVKQMHDWCNSKKIKKSFGGESNKSILARNIFRYEMGRNEEGFECCRICALSPKHI